MKGRWLERERERYQQKNKKNNNLEGENSKKEVKGIESVKETIRRRIRHRKEEIKV